MSPDRVENVAALLGDAENAHGVYERTELNGVYDEAWASWYATWLTGHGLGQLLGRPVDTDELARFLATTFGELKAAQPKPAESWATWTARRIVDEL